jgi:hypothetical protein
MDRFKKVRSQIRNQLKGESTKSSVLYKLYGESCSYQQLPSDQHFQLLELRPGEDIKTGLRGELAIHKIEEAPPYECLSYTWGMEEPDCSLELNCSAFPIRSNLESALLQLRKPDETRILWIDAICDQLKIPERSSQVSMMKDIYATAEQVVIWLGKEKEDDSTGRAFRMIPILTNFTYDELKQYVLDSIISEAFRDDVFSLRNLVRRPWWKRIWVIQESVVARKLFSFVVLMSVLGKDCATCVK